MAEYSPRDLPDAKILYALARHVLAGREHTYRQETNGSSEVAVGRIPFVVDADGPLRRVDVRVHLGR